MAHFRAFFSSDDWLTAADLYDERNDTFFEVDVEIIRITKGTLTTPGKNDKKKSRPAIYMRSLRTGKELPKPLGAGATICETIASIAGTGEMKRWIGQPITLFVTETRVSGKPRPCIRVKPEAPRAQQRGGQQQQRETSTSRAPAQPPAKRDESAPIDEDEARLIREQEAKDNQ